MAITELTADIGAVVSKGSVPQLEEIVRLMKRQAAYPNSVGRSIVIEKNVGR